MPGRSAVKLRRGRVPKVMQRDRDVSVRRNAARRDWARFAVGADERTLLQT